MKKLNEEELSRVLTAHACGGLVRGGVTGESMVAYPGCLVQVAHEVVYTVPDNVDYYSFMEKHGAVWFDDNYDPDWSCDEFLAHLEKVGLA